MANVKLVYGSTTESYWQSTSRVTTPSLICTDGTTTNYIPLLSGSAGGTADSGQYRYTLGHLIVDDKRGAVSRVQYKATNSAKIAYYYSTSVNKVYTLTSGGVSLYTHRITYHLYIRVMETTLNTGSFTGAKVTSSGTNVTGSTYTISKEYTTEYAGQPSSFTPPAPDGSDYKIFVYFKNAGGTTYSAYSEPTWSTSGKSITISKEVVI